MTSDLDRKVFERTRELQVSENALIRSLGEQRVMMDLVSRKVQASVASFRGLLHVNEVEPMDSSAVIERFEATATELLQVSMIVDRSNDIRSALENGGATHCVPVSSERQAPTATLATGGSAESDLAARTANFGTLEM